MTGKPTPTEIEIDDAEAFGTLLKEFALAEAQLEQAKEMYAPLRKALLHAFRTDAAGTLVGAAGGWQATVAYPEKVTWDDDEIAAHYGSDLPIYVKRKLSITETDYSRLPQEERDAMSRARVVGVGTPKITVEKV